MTVASCSDIPFCKQKESEVKLSFIFPFTYNCGLKGCPREHEALIGNLHINVMPLSSHLRFEPFSSRVTMVPTTFWIHINQLSLYKSTRWLGTFLQSAFELARKVNCCKVGWKFVGFHFLNVIGNMRNFELVSCRVDKVWTM
jgi:hypothetical protein